MKEMKKTNIFLILFVMIGGFVTQGSMIFCSTTSTSITTVSMDNFISSMSPTLNFGDSAELRVGDFTFISTDYLSYTYVSFDLGSKPLDVMQTQLILYSSGSSASPAHPIQVNIYYTTESWNEYNLTWSNAPALGTNIGTYTVTSLGSLSFDITNADYSRSPITFVLTTLTSGSTILLKSKESQSIDDNKPHILWTYLNNEPKFPSIPSFSVLLIVGICILITIPITKRFLNKIKLRQIHFQWQ